MKDTIARPGEEEMYFKTAFEATPGVSILIATDAPTFSIVSITDDFLILLPKGVEKDHIIGKSFFELFTEMPVSGHEKDAIYLSFQHVIEHKEQHKLNVDSRNGDRKSYVINRPIADKSGKVVYIMHSVSKASSYNNELLNKAQIKETDKSHSLFMQAPVAICIVSGPDFKVELANESMLKLLSKPPEMVGQPISKTLTEANEQGLIAILNEVRTTKKPYHVDSFPATLLINGHRETRYFDLVFKPYQNSVHAEGEGIFCLGYNVTEQVLDRKKIKEVTERLNYRNALLEAQNEATPDGVVVVDQNKKIVLYNNRFAQIWKMPQEVIDSNDDEAALQHAMTMLKDPQGFLDRVTELYTHKKEQRKDLIHFKDGRVVERDGTPIVGEDGVYYGWAWYFRDITDRLVQEHRFRSMVELAPDPIFILTGEDLILDVANEPLFQIWNVDRSVIGKPFLQILPEMEGQVFPGLMYDVMRKGEPVSGIEMPTVFKRADGREETRYFNFKYQPFPELDGKINGVLALATDVTEQVMAKQKLVESERNFRNMILQSPVAMCILKGKDLVLEEANAPMYELWGRNAEELLHKPIFEGLPEAKAQGLEEIVKNVFKTGESFSAHEVPIKLPRKEGVETFYVNFVYLPFRESDGTISGIMAVATDVTQQVVARHKVEESEHKMKRFKFMADHAQDPFILMRADGSFAYLNSKALEAWGYTEEEAKNIRVPDVDPIYNDQVFSEAFARAQRERIAQLETLHKRSDGHIYPVEINMGGLQIGGEPYLFAIARNITERQKNERKLAQSEARSRLAVEAARLGTFDIDVQRQTIIHSQRINEIFGLPQGEGFPYNGFVDMVHPDDRLIRSTAHTKALETGELFYEVRIIRTDSTIRWIRLNGKYMFDNSVPVSLVGTVLDITEEKKAAELLEQKIEERTFELQRANEQLKQFTYAASHDLQEPLRKISFFLDRLFNGLEATISEDNKRIIERIQHTAGRMRNLINDLLDYSNTTHGSTRISEIDLNKVAGEVVDDMEATIIETGAVVSISALPVVKGDERQLRQLFQNIISNGIKYAKKDEPPIVKINSTLIDVGDAQGFLPNSISQSMYHQIKIADNGIGFDPDDAERIFRLFQRLHGKAEYEGTGVGLAIVQKVAENHGGTVWAEGFPGKGSTFNILLPAV